jgi:hypothetical protein
VEALVALQNDEMPELAAAKARITAIEQRLDREDQERRRREDQQRDDEDVWREELRGRLDRIEKRTERINAVESDVRARSLLCDQHGATAQTAMAKVVALEASINAQLASITSQLQTMSTAASTKEAEITAQLTAISTTAATKEAEQRGTVRGATWVVKALWLAISAGGGALLLKLVEGFAK